MTINPSIASSKSNWAFVHTKFRKIIVIKILKSCCVCLSTLTLQIQRFSLNLISFNRFSLFFFFHSSPRYYWRFCRRLDWTELDFFFIFSFRLLFPVCNNVVIIWLLYYFLVVPVSRCRQRTTITNCQTNEMELSGLLQREQCLSPLLTALFGWETLFIYI